jgi:hypothetical protein
VQLAPCALALAWDKAGKSRAARMAIIAITTNSSIKVKPFPSSLQAGWQSGSRLLFPDNWFMMFSSELWITIILTAPDKISCNKYVKLLPAVFTAFFRKDAPDG